MKFLYALAASLLLLSMVAPALAAYDDLPPPPARSSFQTFQSPTPAPCGPATVFAPAPVQTFAPAPCAPASPIMAMPQPPVSACGPSMTATCTTETTRERIHPLQKIVARIVEIPKRIATVIRERPRRTVGSCTTGTVGACSPAMTAMPSCGCH